MKNQFIKQGILITFLSFLSCLTALYSQTTIRILAIGNSFSEDAAESFVDDLAKADGVSVIVGNLYWGGCSLETHWNNANTNNTGYSYRKIVNGVTTVLDNKSMQYAIKDDKWDYITFQQASEFSGRYNTFFPYLTNLMNYVKSNATNPNVKFALHRTWSYAFNSTHSGYDYYHNNQFEMYDSIVNAYSKVSAKTGISIIIPTGTAIQNGRSSYIGDNFNRDTYHLTYGLGRYTAACAFYEKMLGKSAIGNSFYPTDVSKAEAIIAQNAAHNAVIDPNRVTSLATIPAFFQNCSYSGYTVSLTVGDYNYAALSAKNIKNDDISSLKIPAGYKVIVYQDDNFTGSSTTFTGNDDCLADNGWDNKITSLKIRANGVTGKNGTYSIQNRNSGMYMDVAGASTADGGNILQWTGSGATNQQFKLTDVGDGAYSIIGVQSGKAVDVSGGSSANLADVLQWTYNGANNQKIVLIATDNGYYKLKVLHSGKLIDVTGGGLAAGVDIIQWDDNNQANGQWKLNAPGTKLAQIATDISDVNTTEISVFPNPATDILILTNIPANSTITVLNTYGQKLFSTKSSSTNIEVNISGLKAGAYFLKISESKIVKFLKK